MASQDYSRISTG